MLRGFISGFRLQLSFFRNYTDSLIPLVAAPLFAIIFSMVLRHSGRADISGYSVLAAFYITLWRFAIFNGGWVIQIEKWDGTINYLVASPPGLAPVVVGRISTMMLAGGFSFIEMWLFGKYVLHAGVTIHHWYLFLASLVLTLAAMTTTSLFMANLFVLSRAAVAFSNSLSYPGYLLGGILVPVPLLPGWLRPVTTVVFLSWSSRLLQGCLSAAPVPNAGFDLMMLALLGLAALVLGSFMLRRTVRRVRLTGELALQ